MIKKRHIIAALLGIFFSYQNSLAMSWIDSTDEKLYQQAEVIFDAEFESFFCQNKPVPFAECIQMSDPSKEDECVGVFRIIAKTKGEGIEHWKYRNIKFKTAVYLNVDCLIDPQRHLFFKKGDKIRIFDIKGEKKFIFLDEQVNQSIGKIPSLERVLIKNNFTDLQQHQCLDIFNFFNFRGVISGFEDQTARPDKLVSRAEFLSILTKALSLEKFAKAAKESFLNENSTPLKSNIEIHFNDVLKNDWFADFVALAWEKYWIDGFSDGSFRPHSDISFAQGLKIVLNAFQIPILQSHEDKNLPWYTPFFRTAANIEGVEKFTADKKLTRCEMLNLIYAVEKEKSKIEKQIAAITEES